jgi:hypothetical protein
MDPLLKAIVYEALASACIGAAEDAFERGRFDESNASMEHAALYLYRSDRAMQAAVAAHD